MPAIALGPLHVDEPPNMPLSSIQHSLRRLIGIPASAAASVNTAPTGRRPWLLLYNCQGMGLANSLNLMCNSIEVESHDPAGFGRNRESIIGRLCEFDRILIAPQLENTLALDLAGLDTVWRIPTITFDAYHPDICYLVQSGKSLKGPLGDYHSLIAYAAFCKGLDERHTLALFTERVYAALGYFDRWDGARVRLLELFSAHGLDIAARYANWSRTGPFMYSFNHVRIHCLRDVALAILERAGLAAQPTDLLPHDNLANGPCYPIYPEIGARLGVSGNYLFKLGGKYQCIGLEEYVAASFDLYRSSEGVDIRPTYARPFAHALSTIEQTL